ncbi:Predicted unusual protein kinase regulating ubiquinone biosynthesis, AarF/ABC1/UbiB family [Thermomonospora echinospora]|uniref:Predicted unusual protein kinase regulating ubiquinone biosynthesis, AarF/ABC1/UbiB family n=1 Tax=Thermomonospora echinospora TaxID=1992 RepID=A0A1H6DVD7_9ACTN|nr:AarF/ABC1/UbiB kinase family protein [Thermomonospora echinospora]SEG88713.1 Predicted unusual protein kinase regulating ubiquinone biosynthesis, AarF/ABC1/UbiB family [Thermomonospora echinospora]
MRFQALNRMVRLSALPLGIAGRAGLASGLKVLGRLTDESALELHERTADQLFEVLGGLRGGVMKFGQVLSVYEAVLPPSISDVYRERLARLQDAARPESVDMVYRVMAQDIGPTWQDLFASFEFDAAAAASLGQVHRAVWHDGRSVAVKLQYPDAREQLLGDRDLLVFAMRWFTSLVAPELDGRALAVELMDRIAEELDYEHEAQAQSTFRSGFSTDSDFHIPEVILQNGGVLVSEWIDGTPLAQIISSGSQTERDRAGLLLTRLMFSGIPRCGLMHGDPHPGNFRLQDDGRLGVLDFGAVHHHSPGTESPLQKWMRIHLADDSEQLLHILRELEFLPPGIRVDAERLKDLFARTGAPVHTDLFKFDAAYLRDALGGLTASMPVGLSLAFPPNLVQAQRALGVAIGVLCQLEAEVPFRDEGIRWLSPTLQNQSHSQY